MNNLAIVDMVATGNNILVLRRNAGMTVKDLQQVFGFAWPLLETGNFNLVLTTALT